MNQLLIAIKKGVRTSQVSCITLITICVPYQLPPMKQIFHLFYLFEYIRQWTRQTDYLIANVRILSSLAKWRAAREGPDYEHRNPIACCHSATKFPCLQ